MTRLFQCDQCDGYVSAVPFELVQVCEELDDDGEQIVQILHLCTTQCLCNYAMALALDLPDNEGAAGG